METKFLSDGRKVAVVGFINQQEAIVQEIFVSEDGDQFPSGEKFTAKSLHDKPVKSYAAKQAEREEGRIKKLKLDVACQYDKLSSLKTKLSAANDLMKSCNRLQGKLDSFDWDLFCDVATGNIEYIVQTGCHWYKPQLIDKGDYHYDKGYNNERYDGLRMISLVWHSERDYSYNMFNYADGSGAASPIKVFRDKKELCDWLKQKAEEAHIAGELTIDQVICLDGYIDTSLYRESLEIKEALAIKERYEKAIELAKNNMEKALSRIGLK